MAVSIFFHVTISGKIRLDEGEALGKDYLGFV
jgi:hypothetical protein